MNKISPRQQAIWFTIDIAVIALLWWAIVGMDWLMSKH